MIPVRFNKIYGVEYYSDIYFKYENPRQYRVLSDTTLYHILAEKNESKKYMSAFTSFITAGPYIKYLMINRSILAYRRGIRTIKLIVCCNNNNNYYYAPDGAKKK